jgi:hypothetical protein
MSEPVLPYVIVATILLLGLTQKLWELRRSPRDPARRAVCACLAGLSAAPIVQLFAVAIDNGTGVAHLAEMTSDAAAMIAACAGQVFLIHITYPALSVPTRARRRRLGLVAALAAVVILFAATPPATAHRPGNDSDAVYMYVYISYVGISLLSVCRLSLRYARLTDRPSLRLGLWIITAGGLCGLAFLAVQAAMLVGDEAGVNLRQWDDRVALPLELVTQALLLVGIIVPAWGARLAGVIRWFGDHRSYRLLHPLWLALHEANPELVLVPQDTEGRRRWHRDVGFLLYRQVIEIRDGQLALRPYIDPGVAELATELGRQAGLSREGVRAAGEAAAVAAGIAAKTRGQRPHPAPPVPGSPSGGTDVTTEIAWLTRVSQAFATSPIIPAALAAISSQPQCADRRGRR